jgi:hypothetical protein
LTVSDSMDGYVCLARVRDVEVGRDMRGRACVKVREVDARWYEKWLPKG